MGIAPHTAMTTAASARLSALSARSTEGAHELVAQNSTPPKKLAAVTSATSRRADPEGDDGACVDALAAVRAARSPLTARARSACSSVSATPIAATTTKAARQPARDVAALAR